MKRILKIMITLATLNEATLEEIFDHVATHLMCQNEKSIGPNGYVTLQRGDGFICSAIGCLIGYDEYDPEMELAPSLSNIIGLEYPDDKYRLLDSLEMIHDHLEVEEWPSALAELAADFNLQW